MTEFSNSRGSSSYSLYAKSSKSSPFIANKTTTLSNSQNLSSPKFTRNLTPPILSTSPNEKVHELQSVLEKAKLRISRLENNREPFSRVLFPPNNENMSDSDDERNFRQNKSTEKKRNFIEKASYSMGKQSMMSGPIQKLTLDKDDLINHFKNENKLQLENSELKEKLALKDIEIERLIRENEKLRSDKTKIIENVKLLIICLEEIKRDTTQLLTHQGTKKSKNTAEANNGLLAKIHENMAKLDDMKLVIKRHSSGEGDANSDKARSIGGNEKMMDIGELNSLAFFDDQPSIEKMNKLIAENDALKQRVETLMLAMQNIKKDYGITSVGNASTSGKETLQEMQKRLKLLLEDNNKLRTQVVEKEKKYQNLARSMDAQAAENLEAQKEKFDQKKKKYKKKIKELRNKREDIIKTVENERKEFRDLKEENENFRTRELALLNENKSLKESLDETISHLDHKAKELEKLINEYAIKDKDREIEISQMREEKSREIFHLQQQLAVKDQNLKDMRVELESVKSLREEVREENNRKGSEWENFAIEQLSMIILTNSKEKELDNRTRQAIKSHLGPKFSEIIDKYLTRIRELEYKNNHLWQRILINLEREINSMEESKSTVAFLLDLIDKTLSIKEGDEKTNALLRDLKNNLKPKKSAFQLKMQNLQQEMVQRQLDIKKLSEEELFENTEGDKFNIYENLLGENHHLQTKIRALQFEQSNIKTHREVGGSNKSFNVLPDLDEGFNVSPHRSKRSVTPSRELSNQKKSDSKKQRNANEMAFSERNEVLHLLVAQASALENIFLREVAPEVKKKRPY